MRATHPQNFPCKECKQHVWMPLLTHSQAEFKLQQLSSNAIKTFSIYFMFLIQCDSSEMHAINVPGCVLK